MDSITKPYEDLIKYLLLELEKVNSKLKDRDLRLGQIQHTLTSEITTARYGEIKKFESNE